MCYLSDQNFDEHLQHKSSMMVTFSAEWCGSCKAMAPVLDQIDLENSFPIAIAKLDVDESPITAIQYRIRSIPTVLFFKNGTLVDTVVGPVSKAVLTGKIHKLIEA